MKYLKLLKDSIDETGESDTIPAGTIVAFNSDEGDYLIVETLDRSKAFAVFPGEYMGYQLAEEDVQVLDKLLKVKHANRKEIFDEFVYRHEVAQHLMSKVQLPGYCAKYFSADMVIMKDGRYGVVEAVDYREAPIRYKVLLGMNYDELVTEDKIERSFID